jgi:hypothetical protein
MAQINKSMFRQYDIRGQVRNDEMSEASIELIGRAFGTFIRRHGGSECVVGHDARSYSPGLAQAYSRGLNSAGVNVLFIGQVLTPITQASQYYLKSLYSGMITASHNPNGWSGLKQGIGYSLTVSGDDIQSLYRMITDEDFETGNGTFTVKSILDDYGNDVVSRVQIMKPLTVVVNARHGSAGSIVPAILRKAGALSHNRRTEFVFTWDKALSFEGNTGPYLQYSHARIHGILRKAGSVSGFESSVDEQKLSVQEITVLRKLHQFPEVVEQVIDDNLPNVLCNYLFELSQDFNSFYQAIPVLQESDELVRRFRLSLVTATAQVLNNGLSLLGIEAPEEM